MKETQELIYHDADPYFSLAVLYGNDAPVALREHKALLKINQKPLDPVLVELAERTIGNVSYRLQAAEVVRELGADSLTQHMSLFHNSPIEDNPYLLQAAAFEGTEDFSATDLVKGLTATKVINERINKTSTGQKLASNEIFELARSYNGTFKQALITLAAEKVHNLKTKGEEKSPAELGIYLFLLELIEEYDILRFVQDAYVESEFPQAFQAYNEAATLLFGQGDQRRKTIDRERELVSKYAASLSSRLIRSGLYHPMTHEEYLQRMEEVLKQAYQDTNPDNLQMLGESLVGQGDFYVSGIREKSAGSVVLKGLRYANQRSFIDTYSLANNGEKPDIGNPITWKRLLQQLPDAHAFRVILPTRYHVGAVADFLIATAFGELSDLNYGPSTFRDPRNEYFVDNKYENMESKMNGINVNLRDPQSLIPFEVQLMTGRDAIDYFHGPANRVLFKQEKNGFGNGLFYGDNAEFVDLLVKIRNTIRVS